MSLNQSRLNESRRQQTKKVTMRRFLSVATLSTLLGLTGCDQGTSGGPGVADADVSSPTYGQKEDTFNLIVPLMATSLQQGTTLETVVGIDRAENFGEDVSLKFFSLPEGVTVTPANPVIKRGDDNASILFTADDTAVTGEYRLKVFGHPEKGPDGEIEFRLDVSPMDSFSLSLPWLSTSLAQSEAATVSVGIRRDKTFASEVTLHFGKLPAGVTMEPAEPMIPMGEKETDVILTASSEAALGDFTIAVTGHPSSGPKVAQEFKLTVVQK